MAQPHRFKHGNTAGKLGGRPVDPPELKALKNLTKAELVRAASVIVKSTMADLQKIANDPDAMVLDAMIAGVAINVMKRGDMTAFNLLLDRLIGRVKGDDGLPPPTNNKVLLYIPDNNRRKVMKQIDAKGEVSDV